MKINGRTHPAPSDPRVSLLDHLRETLGLTGTKLGCNQGACGACTVLIDGERALACLTLAVQAEGREVTTVEGLSEPDGALHPLQKAFLDRDGFQCGYCTPGQLMSAIGMAAEHRRGAPSAITPDLAGMPDLSGAEIRERMSGNLCRCGAHNGIVEAIADWTGSEGR